MLIKAAKKITVGRTPNANVDINAVFVGPSPSAGNAFTLKTNSAPLLTLNLINSKKDSTA